MIILECDMSKTQHNLEYIIYNDIRKFLKINRLCNSEKTFFKYINSYNIERPFIQITFNYKANICYIYDFYRIAINYIITRRKYSSNKMLYRIHDMKIYKYGYKYTKEEREKMYNKSLSKDFTNFHFDILSNNVMRYNIILCCMLISEYIMKKYSWKFSKNRFYETYAVFQEHKICILINEVTLLIKEIRLDIIKNEFYNKCKNIEND